MLKLLILSTVLLNFAACLYMDENVEKLCEAEQERFRFCIEIFVNATKVEAQKMLVEISSTVSPLGSPVAREFKKSLKCIGDLECKGQLKLTKFQLDTTDFYTDRVLEAQECIEDEEISKSLGNCVVFFKEFQFPKGFSSTVVPCVKKVLEGTDCSTDQKVGLERGAHAMSDLYDHLDKVFADISYATNFDLNFDPRKY
ncbi:Protein CBG10517 [Caenorhabditis briggsae]|uniref:Uncharacterized protein n=2 Tax=Caenorhabditis briggsae TaxID=6238 RepID=A0AAE9CZ34_CAEBR|nr:Protein CBG10517 [Caenorhabditis briggsae]ULT86995.1 hypothetical protein L3Y34_006625 [Caenorhabditis briggsae]CAP29926.1 Protein CBG10517 [Caenorhabditis briggsae]